MLTQTETETGKRDREESQRGGQEAEEEKSRRDRTQDREKQREREGRERDRDRQRDLTNATSCMNRADEVILLRLKNGRNRLSARLFNKMKMQQSEMCPCNTAPMTSEHLHLPCPPLDTTLDRLQ